MEPTSRSCRVHNLDLKREAVSASVFVQILAYVAYTRLIWNLCLSGKSAIQHALHSHYRAITDINWHTQDPDVVVSTGIDSWLWAWDLRAPKKPIMGRSISVVTSYSRLTAFFARPLRFQWYVSSLLLSLDNVLSHPCNQLAVHRSSGIARTATYLPHPT
jgi:hypothetical protein